MTLLHGDCLETLKSLEANSLDALVTDPPAGISFMGKEWDGDKGGRAGWVEWMRDVMREALRVMKPGAHGLVWALPRTSHWTATALEDAGFEVRDIVTHLFGSGFPKSLDVSKAIDKAAGAARQRVPIIDVSTGKAKSPDIAGGMFKPGKEFTTYSNEGVTDAAKKWQGFGTALKPASEHWILIRKSISEKTVAANVLKWGCGAINVDASRVQSNGDHKRPFQPTNSDRNVLGKQTAFMPTNAEGRFPANLILSHTEDCEPDQCVLDCAVYALDLQSGVLKSGAKKSSHVQSKPAGNGVTHGYMGPRPNVDIPADLGGASRFFYCAKASKRDKNAGLENPTKTRRSSDARPNSGDYTGKFPDHDHREKVGNFHPTVKSTALMTYLIRMVTPPGGTVLDPFMGSGSTGVAAIQSGFQFIGIEREAEYLEIASKRVGAS